MNVLELVEDYLEVEAVKDEKEKLKPYYLALKNLYEFVQHHPIFEIEFRDMFIVSKKSSQFDKEYLLFVSTETTKYRTDYQMLLHSEDVWLGYEDDYSLPRIEFIKSECILDYVFKGDDYSLINAEKDFNAKFFKPEKSMDEIHCEALIENYEREICKLTKM